MKFSLELVVKAAFFHLFVNKYFHKTLVRSYDACFIISRLFSNANMAFVSNPAKT